jgi:hypothetical protein
LSVIFLLFLPLVTPRIYAVDSVEYFVYLPSALFDGDLDFYDEYSYFIELNPEAGIEGVRDKRDPTTGLPLNVAPVGTAVLWSPAYLVAHVGVLTARSLGAQVPADGLARPYLWAACFASVAYTYAGLLLCYRLCRRFFAPLGSALAVALVWLATPAFFYSHVNPPWSHSASLFTVALFASFWHKTRDRRTMPQFFVLGLFGGLMALVREQDGLFLLIPAIEALVTYLGMLRRREWAALPALLARHLLLLVGVCLAFSPQMLVYRVLNGRFGPNPTVGYKFDWLSPHFFQVLGDPHYGLFVWTPLVLFALIGLVFLFRRDRLLAAVFASAFLAQVYITGSFLTWQSPGSFGQRRFINCTVIFALGLAALLAYLRQRGWPAWILVSLGGLFVAWNWGLVVHWVLYRADREAGLLWDRLPRRLLVEIPQRGPRLLWQFLFERGAFMENPGN